MVKTIVKDPLFLARRSEEATKQDRQIGIDLLDTLQANSNSCVGMAANMIGELKRIIAVDAGGKYILMYNPKVLQKSAPRTAEEGCLSLSGIRKAVRYAMIQVGYLDGDFNPQTQMFMGFTAQIIQHEIDHCNGILI